MTQTTDGAFELIENIAATSANKYHESDRSKKVNSVDTQKIDELTTKVVQRLKKITKGKSSSWRKLRLSRFRTLKRLLLRLKRRETISRRSATSTDMGICRTTRHKVWGISKASHITFCIKHALSVRHITGSRVRIRIKIKTSNSRRATSKLLRLPRTVHHMSRRAWV